MTQVRFSHREDKFFVQNGSEVHWFDSILEAEDAARQIEIEKAVRAERDRIVSYMREVRPSWEGELLADEIEAMRHLK